MKYNISVQDQTFEIEIGKIAQGAAQVNVNGVAYDVRIDNYPAIKTPSSVPSMPTRLEPVSIRPSIPQKVSPPPVRETVAASGDNVIMAPLPGLIVDVKVKVGDVVQVGQILIIMEAMKMENRIAATVSGTVKEIRVQKGTDVMTGAVLLVIG